MNTDSNVVRLSILLLTLGDIKLNCTIPGRVTALPLLRLYDLSLSLSGGRFSADLAAGHRCERLVLAGECYLILVRVLYLDGFVLQEMVGDQSLAVADGLLSILRLNQILLDSFLEAEPHVFLHFHHF